MALAVLVSGCGSTAASSPPAAGPEGSIQIEIVTTTVPGAALTDATGPVTPAPTAVAPVAYTVVAHATVPSVIARAEPSEGASVVAELASPIASGADLVFQAVNDGGVTATNPDWIEVLLPVEPNGTTGWVQRSDVELSNNPYRVAIDRSTFSLKVYDLDELVIDTAIGVGTGDTPTPVGHFYLLELLAPPNPDGPYGPYAFGLSGFSEVLDGFAGADTAIIGIHGTNDPSALGSTVSHGCIRVANDVIEQLAVTLPLGTPVEIT